MGQLNSDQFNGLRLNGYKGALPDMWRDFKEFYGLTGTSSLLAFYKSYGFDTPHAFWKEVVDVGGVPPDVPPSVIVDFAASDDQIESVIMTFTNATGTPAPTYNLFKGAAEVAVGISSGFVYPTPPGGGTYHVKAINNAGTVDSNTDSGQSLPAPVVAILHDTFTDVAGTLLSAHVAEVGGLIANDLNMWTIRADGASLATLNSNSTNQLGVTVPIEGYIAEYELGFTLLATQKAVFRIDNTDLSNFSGTPYIQIEVDTMTTFSTDNLPIDVVPISPTLNDNPQIVRLTRSPDDLTIELGTISLVYTNAELQSVPTTLLSYGGGVDNDIFFNEVLVEAL